MIIRARDEAASIGAVLDALAAQTLAHHEVVVVDSGSRDGTVELVRARASATQRLLELPPEQFTFGRALNRGTALARAPVVVALSAHAVPRDPGWLARMVAAFSDDRVVCAYGPGHFPRGAPLDRPVYQDAAAALATPGWGYSNGAGGFRRSLWDQRPFREDLPASEDLEWARWALGQAPGRICLLDPALAVDHDHAHDPLLATFRRAARERRGLAAFAELPPYGSRELAHEWWADRGWHASATRARLSPRRAARLAGTWWGAR